MKTIGFTLLVGLAGYVLGVMLGFVVVKLFSTN
jgi:F0F1-type ATP synthase membrane subunit c/vacuolar-type H+-ATPase subunit K